MLIRPETIQDIAAISSVTREAFSPLPSGNKTEYLLVEGLRSARALLLSLVAEDNGIVVGHIAFSSVRIGGIDYRWLGMGPVSVTPKRQRQGIGTALVKTGLDGIKKLGACGCVVLGSPSYYSRFGFNQTPSLTLPHAPAESFLALSFNGRFPEGQVAYHAAFGVYG
jgi:putative acetyltransferase